MEQTELSLILEQHRLWIESNFVQGKGADLTGADLTGADLTGVGLMGANLTGANLSGADLRGAKLWRANLRGANLGGASLEYAYLNSANLTDANLTGANLTGANLAGATLTGANLTDAYLTNAILPDISWVIPGCLAQLNQIAYGFHLEKERKRDSFIQDSLGFFIQDNSEEKTFDILAGDRIIRGIPYWVKLSGLRQVAAVIV